MARCCLSAECERSEKNPSKGLPRREEETRGEIVQMEERKGTRRNGGRELEGGLEEMRDSRVTNQKKRQTPTKNDALLREKDPRQSARFQTAELV